MSDTTFDELQQIHSDKGPAAALDHLIGVLRSEKRFHQLRMDQEVEYAL